MKLRKKLTESLTTQHQTQKEAQQNDTKKKGHEAKSPATEQTPEHDASTCVQAITEHLPATEQTPEHDASTCVQVASAATAPPSKPLPKVVACSAVQCSPLDLPYLVGTTRDGGCLKCCVSALVEGVVTHMHYPTAYGLDFCTCFCHADVDSRLYTLKCARPFEASAATAPPSKPLPKVGACSAVQSNALVLPRLVATTRDEGCPRCCDTALVDQEVTHKHDPRAYGRQICTCVCHADVESRLYTLKCARPFEASARIDGWNKYQCNRPRKAMKDTVRRGCLTCGQWHDVEKQIPAETLFGQCPCDCHDPMPWETEEEAMPWETEEELMPCETEEEAMPWETEEELMPWETEEELMRDGLPEAAFIRPGYRPLLPRGAAKLEREAKAREGLGQEQARLFGPEVEGFAAPEVGFSNTETLIRTMEAPKSQQERKQQSLFVLGKGRVYPLRAVVDYRGDCETEGGAPAGRWLLDCGHIIVVPRSKDGKLKAKRCHNCPLQYSKRKG